MRNRLVVEQRLFLGIATRGQSKFSFFVLEKDKSAFGARQLQGDVEHRHQNFVEHARRVQLARGFQKQGEFFQVRRFLLDLNARDLTEKFASRVGSSLRRIEQ